MSLPCPAPYHAVLVCVLHNDFCHAQEELSCMAKYSNAVHRRPSTICKKVIKSVYGCIYSEFLQCYGLFQRCRLAKLHQSRGAYGKRKKGFLFPCQNLCCHPMTAQVMNCCHSRPCAGSSPATVPHALLAVKATVRRSLPV